MECNISSHYRLGGKQEYEMSVLQSLKEPVRLQCKRCGHEWLYHGKNPYRARCTFCGTTVMLGGVELIHKDKGGLGPTKKPSPGTYRDNHTSRPEIILV